MKDSGVLVQSKQENLTSSGGAETKMVPSSKEEKPKETTTGTNHRATVPKNSKPEYVLDLNSNDILLGRGAPIINYEGNVRFRELVRSRKAEYIGTGRHQVKDEIARQIIAEVASRKGRFLRRVESLAEVDKLNIPEGKKAWKIAEEDVAVEKTKQALRDKEPVKQHNALVNPLTAGAGLVHDSLRPGYPAAGPYAGMMDPLRGSGYPDDSMVMAMLHRQDRSRQMALLNQQLANQQHLAMLRQQQGMPYYNQQLADEMLARRGGDQLSLLNNLRQREAALLNDPNFVGGGYNLPGIGRPAPGMSPASMLPPRDSPGGAPPMNSPHEDGPKSKEIQSPEDSKTTSKRSSSSPSSETPPNKKSKQNPESV